MAPDTSSTLAALIADREYWSGWATAAAVAVAIGVALESTTHLGPLTRLFRLDRSERRKEAVERLGFWILLIALVAEVPIGTFEHNDTVRIEELLSAEVKAAAGVAVTAKTNAQTALTSAGIAETKAGKAIDRLDLAEPRMDSLEERESQLRGRMDVDESNAAWRRLTPAQSAAIAKSLVGAQFGVVVGSIGNDPEAQALAEQLGAAFVAANLQMPTSARGAMGGAVFRGVRVSGSAELVARMSAALKAGGLRCIHPEIRNGPVFVAVGVRPRVPTGGTLGAPACRDEP